MTPADLTAITNGIVPVLREYVLQMHQDLVAQVGTLKRELDAAQEQILELQTRPTPTVVGPVGEKGNTGIGIASLVISADNRLLAHLTDGRSLDAGPVPQGKDGPQGERGEKGLDGSPGRDGIDGKDGAPGLNGKDGAPGRDGIDGKDGAPGLQGKDGAPGERGLSGEKGIDGLHGRDGRDGAPGLPGTPGEKGLDGKDGLNGRDGIDGVNGKDGANGLHGKDGLDGLGFDDFDLVLDESRGWILRLAQGERVKEWVLGIPFDAKVWTAGTTYPKGAGVTHDGHFWIAQAPAREQPGEGSSCWRLAVRRGKQGKEGRQGKDAPILRPSNTPPLYGG